MANFSSKWLHTGNSSTANLDHSVEEELNGLNHRWLSYDLKNPEFILAATNSFTQGPDVLGHNERKINSCKSAEEGAQLNYLQRKFPPYYKLIEFQ